MASSIECLTNMIKEDLFNLLKKSNISTKEKIDMILSNRVDFGDHNGAMISVKSFDVVADDLIEFFELDAQVTNDKDSKEAGDNTA